MTHSFTTTTPPARSPRKDFRDAPIQVRLAAGLLWLSLALDVTVYVASNLMQPVAIQAVPGAVSSGLATTFSLVAMAVPLVFFAIDGYTTVCIARGRNWARILRLVLAAANVVAELYFPSPASSPLVNVAGETSLVLDLVALAFLFLTPGRAWFARSAAIPAI